MWSAALGYPIPINKRYCESLFKQFSGGKEYFDFNDFKKQMDKHPDMLTWFSKPE
jgi:hypothetical protein